MSFGIPRKTLSDELAEGKSVIQVIEEASANNTSLLNKILNGIQKMFVGTPPKQSVTENKE